MARRGSRNRSRKNMEATGQSFSGRTIPRTAKQNDDRSESALRLSKRSGVRCLDSETSTSTR